MVHTIKKIKEYYKCSECGMQYEDKGWAEKCKAWCKEHHSCNLEITSHAVPAEHDSDVSKTEIADLGNKLFATRLFYGAIGVAASLGLLLLFYWHLRLNSSLANLINNTADKPVYFWLYVILTLGAVVLFGINASLLVYRWRKFGRPKIKQQAGSGAGSLVGVAAAACPVCGSVLLSAIGITGGLAAFPFAGPELKVLSLALLALPIWFMRRDMKKMECGDDTCPVPQDTSFKEKKDPKWLLVALIAIALFIDVGWGLLKTDPAIAKFVTSGNSETVSLAGNQSQNANVATANNPIFDAVVAKVLPEKGFQSKIVLGDSIVKLIENGVIDKAKFEDIYKDRGGLPTELKDGLTNPSNKPILLTRENANFYVNLLWPIGLSNYMESNKKSPMINGNNVFNFASTGGWNLGKEKNGGSYFNKLDIVTLTPDQEALVTKIAQNSYRPCCNNSTFFQDCNHGSALLGLLQLGASQGLSEDDLWREALAFNSFWFSQQYIYNGLYFKVVKGVNWDKVDPKVVMGKDFSSGSGSGNIQAEVAKIPNLIPQQKGGGASCGT